MPAGSTGKISNNTTSGGDCGGGVSVFIGDFLMNDGEISGNTTTENGGGICVGNDATANVAGGSIINNTATTDGGGVFTPDYNLLFVGAGTIFSGNRAATSSPRRDPAYDAVYATNVLSTNWTTPFTQGYNNYDINHNYVPNVPGTGLFGAQINSATMSALSLIASGTLIAIIFARLALSKKSRNI